MYFYVNSLAVSSMATTCGASGSSLVAPGALSTAATEVAMNHNKLFGKANHGQIKYK